MAEIVIQRFNAKAIRAHRSGLVDLLRDAVENGASVSFLPPLSEHDALAWWLKVAEQVLTEERIVIVATQADRVVGCVHVVPATVPNGVHRAEVQKVLVHTEARRQGIARQLMVEMEQIAREAGIKLLMLDTVKDSAGEQLYQGLGWTKIGVVPRFALLDGYLIDTVYYYKEL